ncbi:MAG: hypothetical protein KBT67_11095 [bacterium]|nr:hypothetical protein [Candidatus Limimorpha caballi]
MMTFIFTVIGFVFLIAKIIGVFVFYIIKIIFEIFRDIYKDISKGEYISSGLPDVIEDAFR